jgi:hypothetical protein
MFAYIASDSVRQQFKMQSVFNNGNGKKLKQKGKQH